MTFARNGARHLHRETGLSEDVWLHRVELLIPFRFATFARHARTARED